jgi:hypothetical protein
VGLAGGNYESVEWIKVPLLSKDINPRLPQVAGYNLFIRVASFHGKILGFPHFARINTEILLCLRKTTY